MRKTLIALAALAATIPAAGAFAQTDISPDKRPLEQVQFSQEKTYGYSGNSAGSYQNITPDQRGLGEDGFRHSTQANYGGDAAAINDLSPDKRPLGQ